MKRYVLSVSLMLLPILACNKTAPVVPVQSQTARPAAPPKPVYGWQRIADRTFELQALDTQQFDIPSRARLRVTVTADSGVFGGAFVLSDLQKLPKGTILRRPNFTAAACSLVAVVKGDTACKVNSPSKLVYIVRDKRSEIAIAGAAFFAMHRASKPLENATATNRVELAIDRWGCTANCQTGQ